VIKGFVGDGPEIHSEIRIPNWMVTQQEEVCMAGYFSGEFLELFSGSGELVSKKAGEDIVRIGQPGDTVYVLKSGEARVTLFDGKIEERLFPGAVIGLMGFIEGRTYEDTFVAETDCELIPIDRRRAEFLVHEHPTFAFDIMKCLVERFYWVIDRVKELI
jgi:CRP-like cAMP-binding protein